MFIPSGTAEPRTLLIVLHGMGQSGEAAGGQLIPFAQAHNWVVVAPTLTWGEWREADKLSRVETTVIPQINNVVNHARRESGVAIRARMLVFGFSRGAQSAARMGLLYPESVIAVGAASAGTYTLPTNSARSTSGVPISAPFPFGTGGMGDLFGRAISSDTVGRVQYWIGVGASDNKDADVPRTWDTFIGKNRLERAVRFSKALENAGATTRLFIAPNTGHELLPPMIDDAVQFLARALGQELAKTATAPGRASTATTESPVSVRSGRPEQVGPSGSQPTWRMAGDGSEWPSFMTPLAPARSASATVADERSGRSVSRWWQLVGRYLAQ